MYIIANVFFRMDSLHINRTFYDFTVVLLFKNYTMAAE